MWVVIASPEYMMNVIWYTRSILVEIADLKGFCGLKKCCPTQIAFCPSSDIWIINDYHTGIII